MLLITRIRKQDSTNTVRILKFYDYREYGFDVDITLLWIDV